MDGTEWAPEIDRDTFEQILEMDDDYDREFSSSLYVEFKEQSDQSIVNMQAYLGLDTFDSNKPDDEQLQPIIDTGLDEEQKMKKLSELGHFLKGSSATLGLVVMQRGCEKIQHFGSHKDDQGEASSDSNEELLNKLKVTVKQVKKDFDAAIAKLDKFYGMR